MEFAGGGEIGSIHTDWLHLMSVAFDADRSDAYQRQVDDRHDVVELQVSEQIAMLNASREFLSAVRSMNQDRTSPIASIEALCGRACRLRMLRLHRMCARSSNCSRHCLLSNLSRYAVTQKDAMMGLEKEGLLLARAVVKAGREPLLDWSHERYDCRHSDAAEIQQRSDLFDLDVVHWMVLRGVKSASLLSKFIQFGRAMADTTSKSALIMSTSAKPKLTGRAFYESIGCPKYIVAPMVDRSEFAWRMLTRSYMTDEEAKQVLAYSPMLHARLFSQQTRVRDDHFRPTKESLSSKAESKATRWLDGNPDIDRPLFVQFCANQPDELLDAAEYVAPYCDAVDLNLGCPQGIAKSGRYGAFLQEDWDTIYKMINKLHNELSVPVTAKMRILDTKEETLEYAKMILSAGANILTVHGRRREQKGHNTGLADWTYIRYLRDNLPSDTVIFANGNILNFSDLDACLEATGADGIMSAEGNLSDPTIFAKPPTDLRNREYWRGADGKGGYRLDGVIRRYLDIVYKYVLEQEAPVRAPLYIATDSNSDSVPSPPQDEDEDGPPKKKRRTAKGVKFSPSLRYMQGHLFHLLRPLVSTHTHIRDALAKSRAGDMDSFEKVLKLVEIETRRALQEEANGKATNTEIEDEKVTDDIMPTQDPVATYKRPWWVCQPHIRPLPDEAMKNGALTVSKKEQAKAEAETVKAIKDAGEDIKRDDEEQDASEAPKNGEASKLTNNELPEAATVCG